MINPVIPLWVMIPLSIILFVIIVFKNKNIFKIIRQVIMLVLLFLINIRIMIPSNNIRVNSSNLDVLFVIDNSLSMNAEDCGKNNLRRIEVVREDCKHIIEKLAGARFSVITFNHTSNKILPYIKDNNIAINSISSVNVVSNINPRGSNMSVPLDDVKKSLADGTHDGRIVVLYFISDGENTNSEAEKSYKELASYVDGGAVLGYGTTRGGKMKTKNYEGEEEYVLDRINGNKEAISKIDENNLKKLAREMGVEYIHMEKQEDIDSNIEQVKKLEKIDMDEDTIHSYSDIYFVFVIPFIILLVNEYILYRKKL